MNEKCANCKYLHTLYIPPMVHGIYKADKEQEYRPICLALMEPDSRQDWSAMLLDDTEGFCELYAPTED